MIRNMGNVDRGVRILVAVLIGALYFTGQLSGTVATILLVLAVVSLLTGAVGTCPAYLPFKIDTRSHAEKRHH